LTRIGSVPVEIRRIDLTSNREPPPLGGVDAEPGRERDTGGTADVPDTGRTGTSRRAAGSEVSSSRPMPPIPRISPIPRPRQRALEPRIAGHGSAEEYGVLLWLQAIERKYGRHGGEEVGRG